MGGGGSFGSRLAGGARSRRSGGENLLEGRVEAPLEQGDIADRLRVIADRDVQSLGSRHRHGGERVAGNGPHGIPLDNPGLADRSRGRDHVADRDIGTTRRAGNDVDEAGGKQRQQAAQGLDPVLTRSERATQHGGVAGRRDTEGGQGQTGLGVIGDQGLADRRNVGPLTTAMGRGPIGTGPRVGAQDDGPFGTTASEQGRALHGNRRRHKTRSTVDRATPVGDGMDRETADLMNPTDRETGCAPREFADALAGQVGRFEIGGHRDGREVGTVVATVESDVEKVDGHLLDAQQRTRRGEDGSTVTDAVDAEDSPQWCGGVEGLGEEALGELEQGGAVTGCGQRDMAHVTVEHEVRVDDPPRLGRRKTGLDGPGPQRGDRAAGSIDARAHEGPVRGRVQDGEATDRRPRARVTVAAEQHAVFRAEARECHRGFTGRGKAFPRP